MSPSRWSKLAGLSLSATVVLVLTSPGSAKVNLAATVVMPGISTPKSCSGAFRYAARVGNRDIVEVTPLQAFAKDRRLARMRYTARGMYLEAGISPSQLPTAMCGAR